MVKRPSEGDQSGIKCSVSIYVEVVEDYGGEGEKSLFRKECGSVAEAYTLCSSKGRELEKAGFDIADPERESIRGSTYLSIGVEDEYARIKAQECYYIKRGGK